MPDRDDQASQPTTETPLQGWKEISSYLERDARTAQRWEASAGLPVQRQGGLGGSVYAYPSEIEIGVRRGSRRPARSVGAHPGVV